MRSIPRPERRLAERRSATSALLWLALATAAPAHSAGGEGAEAGDDANLAQPATAMPVSQPPGGIDVIFAVESAQRLISRLDRNRAQAELALSSTAVIQRISDSVAMARRSLSGVQMAEASLAQLMEIDARIVGFHEQVDQSVQTVTQQVQALESGLQAQDGITARLQDLLALPTIGQAPSEIRVLGEQTLKKLRFSLEQTRPVRDRLLILLLNAMQLRLQLDDMSGELHHRRESMGRRLRSADRQVVWRVDPETEAAEWVGAREALSAWWTGVTEHVTRHSGIIGLISVILLVCTRWLFGSSRTLLMAEMPYATIARGALRLMERPGWAMLMVLLLALNLILPRGPIAYYDCVWLIILLPAVLLTQAIHGPPHRVSVFVLGVAMLAFPFRTVIELLPHVERSVMGLQSLAMALALTWDWRRARAAMVSLSARRWLDGVALLVIGGLLLALCANLLGRIGLARLLVDGFLGSLGFAMVYSVALEVSFALLVGLLGKPLAGYSRIVKQNPRLAAYGLRRLLRWIAVGLFGFSALYAFRIQDEVLPWLGGLWDAQLTLGHTAIQLNAVALSVLLLLGTWWLLRMTRLLLEVEILPRFHFVPGMAFTISTLARYAIAVSGFVLATLALGIDLSRVTVLAGALGVGVGFGLQNIVNNFFSGLILLFERPVHVDDVIEIGSLRGAITRIGIRSSTIKTAAGAEVIVPNSDLIAKEVINWTLSDRRRRLEITLGVAYGTPVPELLTLLLDVARTHPEVLDDPAPSAFFMGFGESALDFKLNAWIEHYEENLRIASELRVAICRALDERKIEIPFPQRDLRIRSLPGDHENVALAAPFASSNQP